MNPAEIHRAIADALTDRITSGLAVEGHDDGVLLIEQDDTEWWITAVRQP